MQNRWQCIYVRAGLLYTGISKFKKTKYFCNRDNNPAYTYIHLHNWRRSIYNIMIRNYEFPFKMDISEMNVYKFIYISERLIGKP